MEILFREVDTDYAFALIQGDSGLEYSILIQADEFNMCSCGCPDQQFRKHICKHIDFFLDYLECVYPEYWVDHVKFLREEDSCRKRNEKKSQGFSLAQSCLVP